MYLRRRNGPRTTGAPKAITRTGPLSFPAQTAVRFTFRAHRGRRGSVRTAGEASRKLTRLRPESPEHLAPHEVIHSHASVLDSLGVSRQDVLDLAVLELHEYLGNQVVRRPIPVLLDQLVRGSDLLGVDVVEQTRNAPPLGPQLHLLDGRRGAVRTPVRVDDVERLCSQQDLFLAASPDI